MARDRLLRLPEVLQLVGLSKSTIYDMMSRGEFPAQVLLGRRAVGWWESQIEEWKAARPPVRASLIGKGGAE